MGKLIVGVNDLATVAPELLNEWDWKKNEPNLPQDFSVGSHQHVYWKCKRCGYEWSAEVRMRAKQGQGCKKCSKDKVAATFRKNLLQSGKKSFAEEHPDIAREWDYEKNAPHIPEEYTSGSGEKVSWICAKCGYGWTVSIINRTRKHSGCPLCAGNKIVSGVNDLKTKSPALAEEWHPTKNLPKRPETTAPFSSDKVWWICKYGHEYQCRVADRQKGVGCSECSKRFRVSLPEKIFEYYVKQYCPNTVSNYRPSFLKGSEIDIFDADSLTGIEYDGQRYHKSVDRDVRKDRLCSANGVRLIRIREPKCPKYERDDPTITLDTQSDFSISKAVVSLLSLLGITGIDINITNNWQDIMEEYRSTALSGNIAEDYPNIVKEWHPKLNGNLKPENIPSTKSKDEYYWRCKACGHSWKASLYERIRGTGCPACARKVIVPKFNDLATTHPNLALEWHPTKNGDLTPQTVSKGQDIYAWWKCNKCGHEWEAKIKKRALGAGCDECSKNQHRVSQYKKVYQFTESGEYVNEFESARIAAKALNISRSSIQHVCTGIGNSRTAGGYTWSYYPNGNVEFKGHEDLKMNHVKAVLQYNLEGKLIMEYGSVKEAALEVGISQNSVRQACKGTHGRKTAGGFVWRYKE